MRELPKLRIYDKEYFLDERLNEMRNVSDPLDTESMEGMSSQWWLDTLGGKFEQCMYSDDSYCFECPNKAECGKG